MPHIAITHGKRGASFYSKDKKVQAEAKKVENVIDSTGAGDNFAAAFLTVILEEKEFEKALEFANRAASLSVQKKGARAMPWREKLERLQG